MNSFVISSSLIYFIVSFPIVATFPIQPNWLKHSVCEVAILLPPSSLSSNHLTDFTASLIEDTIAKKPDSGILVWSINTVTRKIGGFNGPVEKLGRNSPGILSARFATTCSFLFTPRNLIESDVEGWTNEMAFNQMWEHWIRYGIGYEPLHIRLIGNTVVFIIDIWPYNKILPYNHNTLMDVPFLSFIILTVRIYDRWYLKGVFDLCSGGCLFSRKLLEVVDTFRGSLYKLLQELEPVEDTATITGILRRYDLEGFGLTDRRLCPPYLYTNHRKYFQYIRDPCFQPETVSITIVAERTNSSLMFGGYINHRVSSNRVQGVF